MSLAESLDDLGVLPTRFIPNLRVLGYTNEGAGKETRHVIQTRQQLQTLGNRVSALEAGGGSSGLATRVAELEELVDRLLARLAYAENYLKMIDEAIAVEGFSGWAPPS